MLLPVLVGLLLLRWNTMAKAVWGGWAQRAYLTYTFTSLFITTGSQNRNWNKECLLPDCKQAFLNSGSLFLDVHWCQVDIQVSSRIPHLISDQINWSITQCISHLDWMMAYNIIHHKMYLLFQKSGYHWLWKNHMFL